MSKSNKSKSNASKSPKSKSPLKNNGLALEKTAIQTPEQTLAEMELVYELASTRLQGHWMPEARAELENMLAELKKAIDLAKWSGERVNLNINGTTLGKDG